MIHSTPTELHANRIAETASVTTDILGLGDWGRPQHAALIDFMHETKIWSSPAPQEA